MNMMKKNRTAFAASVALAALLPIMTPTTAAAWGPSSLAKAVAEALEKVLASQTGQLATNEKLDGLAEKADDQHKDQGDWWEQFIDIKVAADKDALSNDAKMRELEDERARLRAVQGERFDAAKDVSSTHMGCVIKTRLREGSNYNRPDRVVSATTLQTLEQMAAYNLGEPVGGSGDPVETVSYSDKVTRSYRHWEASGAPKDASVMFHSAQFAGEGDLLRCRSFAAMAGSSLGEDLDTKSSENDPNSGEESDAIIRHNNRKSVSDLFMQGYCSVRGMVTIDSDPIKEGLIKVAKSLPGYKEENYTLNGVAAMSPRLERQLMAHEWEYRFANEVDFKKEDAARNQSQNIHFMASNVAFLSRQVEGLHAALDDNNVILATQLGALNDIASLLRDVKNNTGG